MKVFKVAIGPAIIGNLFGFYGVPLAVGEFAVCTDGEFANGGSGWSTADGIRYRAQTTAERVAAALTRGEAHPYVVEQAARWSGEVSGAAEIPSYSLDKNKVPAEQYFAAGGTLYYPVRMVRDDGESCAVDMAVEPGGNCWQVFGPRVPGCGLAAERVVRKHRAALAAEKE